jgi:uncharacterized protein (TIGR00369 family)
VTGERAVPAADAVVDDGRCFACGPRNEAGLRLRFDVAGEGEVRCVTTLASVFQGWVGMAHGGIAVMLLDEAMAHAAGAAGHRGVTAEVRVRFRRALPLGEPLSVRGRVVSRRRNVLRLEASVANAAGTLLASGQGSFVVKGVVAPGGLGGTDAG